MRFKPALWDGSDPLYAPCTVKSKGRVYWRATKTAQGMGYVVGPVALPGLAGDNRDEERATLARELTRDMVRWMETAENETRLEPGTFHHLIARYLSDEISPIRDVKQNTREQYRHYGNYWRGAIGDMLVMDADYAAIRRWEKAMKENGRSIHFIATSFRLLRIFVNYGVQIEFEGAAKLSLILSKTRFKSPKPRTIAPTAEQIAAVIEKADELGYRAFATGYMMQWWFALRAVDVRGQYLRPTDDERTGIMRGGRRWQDGLTWDMIDADLTQIRKTPSKTERSDSDAMVFDLTAVPELRARLDETPVNDRTGPVFVDKNGMPYDRHHWARMFRLAARAAGLPKELKMMDARAGAINDAKRHGATPIQLQHQANHTNMRTTDRYIREKNVSVAEVVKLRRST
ncbi:recombinase [Thioclava sp. GXIMD2076]|uniref:tyrosine-type recombinase/integrase n=1 Tax=Thioclava sp. GXIMD2076 TaxID=3131931 RepID=UPI0030D605F0